MAKPDSPFQVNLPRPWSPPKPPIASICTVWPWIHRSALNRDITASDAALIRSVMGTVSQRPLPERPKATDAPAAGGLLTSVERHTTYEAQSSVRQVGGSPSRP